MESIPRKQPNQVRGWAHLRRFPPLWDGGSLWATASPTGSTALSWALLGSMNGPVWKPARVRLCTRSWPSSLAPAHLPFVGTSPRRCRGRWDPRAGQSTPRLRRPGSGSISPASCAPRGWPPAAARGAGTAGRNWRPWLSASGWCGGSGTLHSPDRAEARPAPETRAAKFQFRFPGGPSLFPAEPPPPPFSSFS